MKDEARKLTDTERMDRIMGALFGAMPLARAGHEPSRKSSRPCRVTIDYRKEGNAK